MTLGPLMVDVAGTELTAEDRRVLAHPLVGSVILFSRNFESIGQLEALVREIRAVRSPPLLVAVDHEGGRVQRFRDGFTVLPPQRAIGRVYDVDAEAGRRLAWQCGWLLAAELRAVGIDMSFAPCVDLDYGVSEVIGDRAYHADAEVVARLAVSCMQGMRAAGHGRDRQALSRVTARSSPTRTRACRWTAARSRSWPATCCPTSG